VTDPDDAAARETVITALGMEPGVARGDPATVDAFSVEVWPKETHRPLRLLVCPQAGSIAGEVRAYAQAVGELLGAHISYFHTPARTGVALDALVGEVERAGYDLVIFGERDQSLVERLLLGWEDRRAAEQVSASLLIARRPRWPLRRVLLIIQGEEGDDAVVDWIVRLARPSDADVTILTVIPPVPAMYHSMARMQQGLMAVLASDSTLGQQMRRAAQQLADWEIRSTLRLCQGPPDWLIHREMVQGDYDLVAVAAERHCRWLRWLLGELVAPVLCWADRPVLITRPTAA
jgi:nucleotide-binding universal stress UspA family protein